MSAWADNSAMILNPRLLLMTLAAWLLLLVGALAGPNSANSANSGESALGGYQPNYQVELGKVLSKPLNTMGIYLDFKKAALGFSIGTEVIPKTNTQANSGTRAGATDAEAGNSSPLITVASPFNTRGIDPSSPSVQTVKSDLYNQYKSSGLSDDLAQSLTNGNISSGSTIPTKRVVVQGETLYKFVPSGKAPGRSSYYFTKSELENFKNNPK